jgi:YD repeat-containing protein
MTVKNEENATTLAYPSGQQPRVRPHAVASATIDGFPLSFTYDANGSMLASGFETFTYDAENRTKTLTTNGNTYTYTYDANGTLVRRSGPGSASTVYAGGIYEKTNTGAIKKYYTAHGRNLVVRDVALRRHAHGRDRADGPALYRAAPGAQRRARPVQLQGAVL